MKKLRWGLITGTLAMLIVISCTTRFPTSKESYTAVQSPAAFERGKVLAFSICAGCHYDRTVNKFIGTRIHDIPGIAGKVYSANLTQSVTNGVTPHYSDAALRQLIKTGVARDGRFLSYMLRPNMAEEDLNALIVYLRSGDPAVSAADTTVGLTHLSFIGKIYMNIQAKPLEYRAGVQLPPASDQVALGYYLVDNLACFHCHSASLKKLDELDPDKTKGYLAGGIKFKGENGSVVHASNITPDRQAGIGKYSEEEFNQAVRLGRAPDRDLKPPMPKFNRLTTNEIAAIYTYLKTVPASNHQIR